MLPYSILDALAGLHFSSDLTLRVPDLIAVGTGVGGAVVSWRSKNSDRRNEAKRDNAAGELQKQRDNKAEDRQRERDREADERQKARDDKAEELQNARDTRVAERERENKNVDLARDEKIAGLEAAYREQLERVKRDLKLELREQARQDARNDENYDRIHAQVVALSEVGMETLNAFERLAVDGHAYSNEELVEKFSDAARCHQNFRKLLGQLYVLGGRIAPLKVMSTKLINVLLDVPRHKNARKARQRVMNGHAKDIAEYRAQLEQLTAEFMGVDRAKANVANEQRERGPVAVTQ